MNQPLTEKLLDEFGRTMVSTVHGISKSVVKEARTIGRLEDIALPQTPGEGGAVPASGPSESDSFREFTRVREVFWTGLLSIPYAQEPWIEVLKQVPAGKLSAEGPLFFGFEVSSQRIVQILTEVDPLRAKLNDTECPSTKESIRAQIASKLVRVPMQPERALAISREVLDLHDQLSRAVSSREDRDPHLINALESALGGDVDSIHSRMTELVRTRDAYVASRERLYDERDSLANRPAHRRAPRGVDTADLLQEGRVGLLKTVERFDPGRGFPFSSSAALWMKAGIKTYLRGKASLVKVPIPHQRVVRAMRNGVADSDNNRFLRPDEVATIMRVDPAVATSLGRLAAPLIRISERAKRTLATPPSTRRGDNPVETVEAIDFTHRLHETLRVLSTVERKAIGLKFGLDNTQESTYREIGEMLGCSEATAYRMVMGALSKLRRKLSS